MPQLNLEKIQKEFGAPAVTLNGGSLGLRGGMACTIKDVGGDEPVMEFIGSTGQVDRYNEVIDQSGWDLAAFRANPVIPDCHDYSSIAKILGRADSVEVRQGALVNTVRFCLDNPLGLMAYKMAKGGFIKSQSVGFIPVEWINGQGDQPDRTYKKCELLEISLVVVPANAGATIGMALKSGAIEKRDVQAVADMLKQFCSDENPNTGGKGTASAAGSYDAELLRIARGLNEVLKRA